MEFKYIAITLCLFLLAFLLYKEFSRASKARLIWRVLANVIAVACFVLLIIPITYNTHLKQSANEIILLTAGTNPDSVAKLKGTKYSFASAEIKGIKANSIPDLSYFLATHKDIRKINVYGYGLANEELKNLEGYGISFHPSEKPNGIISANWLPEIKTTEQLKVQGVYQNSNRKNVKLLFKGLGNSIDSIAVEAKSTKSFSFKNQPKQTGSAIYQLIALQGNDTLAKEPVPFLVAEQPQMKVLILASFPDFEYKFLKKWLYDNQYPLAFRSQISKNKYSSDFLNIDSLNLNRINTASLKKFDVLIIDEEALKAIGPDERQSIENAVNTGMGLFIRISNPKPATALSGKFSRFESPASKYKPLSLLLKDENYKFPRLPLEQTLFLKTARNDQPVIIDGSGKILVNSTIIGSGKILISSISSTFNWLLSGKTDDYAKYWSEILSKTARKKLEIQSVKTFPQFPSINEQTRFVVDLAEAGKVPLLKIDSIKLGPRQNIELPFEWDAVFWPTTHGWNNLSVNQSARSFYVYRNTDWQALRNQQKINLTHLFADKSKNQQRKTATTDLFYQEDVSLWWFFIGFLFASAFLWFESRILDAK
ncbi:hypothetical protein [Pedobacter rhodius]|uniref:Aerotolerance regulator N-terminal domain-containing protein n=1 Tax=Pedobacter rhodius TaxID=3004098 RepID=A0ABT4KW21_9SPHI|nr:hypothetical protein [Pedobacter sp. SJ11]MCZ4222437.1 hypothetical protein [Pedobacter sp. SJ11]